MKVGRHAVAEGGEVGPAPGAGGLARFFVEHREVAWLAFLVVLVWGGFALARLAQQEDPKIPERTALVVTAFPGATALQVGFSGSEVNHE